MEVDIGKLISQSWCGHQSSPVIRIEDCSRTPGLTPKTKSSEFDPNKYDNRISIPHPDNGEFDLYGCCE